MGQPRLSTKKWSAFPWVFTAALSLLLACSPAIAVGVGAAFVGTAALAARCSDPIHVTVVDSVTGLRSCDAKVVAVSASGSEETFSSCFYAALPAGTWTVRADRFGYQPAATPLVITKQQGCEPAVQTIELSILPVGVAPAPGVPVRPLRPNEAPLTPGALPPPGSIGVDSAAPAPAAPSVPSSVPAAPPAASPSGAVPAAPPAASPPAASPPAASPPPPPVAPVGSGGAPSAPPPASPPPPVPR